METKKQAEEAIKAIKALKEFALLINKKKSQVLRGPNCLKELEDSRESQ
jgi:hypothetical protein